jgi:DNA repair protein RecN (Recombination protein N)
MLITLRIKNLALVTDLALDLQPGFNAITGETGAGKSILIGALSLVLGERADRTLIRDGCDRCSVEALFDVSRLKTPLAELLEGNGIEPCEAGQLTLKRVITPTGANRQFANGTPTSLSFLAQIGEYLVDIHGPHDHQSLLQAPRQLAILDAFGKLEPKREAFGQLIAQRAKLESEKASLIVDERTYAQQLDLLRFQVHEISAARLTSEEEEALNQDYQRSRNAARLLELSQAAASGLSADEGGVAHQCGAVGRQLQELRRLDPGASALAELHEQAMSLVGELQAALSRYTDRIDIDPARLQEMEERINTIQGLKRKYGASAAEVIAFGENARDKLRQLEQREAELGRIQAEILALDKEILRAGSELSSGRRKAIGPLRQAASRQLADLGFKQSTFDVALTAQIPEGAPLAQTPAAQGFDTVDFQFAPNAGEPARPLRAIASSGEMARVMLALKTVLAAEDEVPVLVFDEVDANVGGETARTVGEKMKEIGRQRQVLCVTHLAPVAACASAHYRVTKQVKEGRTVSQIARLEEAVRVEELARMLGGDSLEARNHAEALLKAETRNKVVTKIRENR